MDNPSASSDRFNSSYLSMPPSMCIYTQQTILQVLSVNGYEPKIMNLHPYLISQQLYDIHNYHKLSHQQYFQ